jgi:hypothetical protein
MEGLYVVYRSRARYGQRINQYEIPKPRPVGEDTGGDILSSREQDRAVAREVHRVHSRKATTPGRLTRYKIGTRFARKIQVVRFRPVMGKFRTECRLWVASRD